MHTRRNVAIAEPPLNQAYRSREVASYYGANDVNRCLRMQNTMNMFDELFDGGPPADDASIVLIDVLPFLQPLVPSIVTAHT
jgi:hypothetical protein